MIDLFRDNKGRRARYRFRCKCECGRECTPEASTVICKRVFSCGCLSKEALDAGRTGRHSSKQPAHNSWENMISRCNPECVQHQNSIGTYKWIEVCDRWKGRGGFDNFIDDMGPRPDGTTLDRKDNLKGYSPDNCRWASHEDQQNNRAVCRHVLLNGERMTISRAARSLGRSYMKVWHHVNKGLPIESLI